MTHKALRCVRRKGKVFRKYKDKGHPAVQHANKTARRELRKAEYKFEKKLAANIKQDTKSFYAYTRSKSKTKLQIGCVLAEGGQPLEKENDMAERFNHYFASVFTNDETSTTHSSSTTPAYKYFDEGTTAC